MAITNSSDVATPVHHDIVGHPVNLDAIYNIDSSSDFSDLIDHLGQWTATSAILLLKDWNDLGIYANCTVNVYMHCTCFWCIKENFLIICSGKVSIYATATRGAGCTGKPAVVCGN